MTRGAAGALQSPGAASDSCLAAGGTVMKSRPPLCAVIMTVALIACAPALALDHE